MEEDAERSPPLGTKSEHGNRPVLHPFSKSITRLTESVETL